MEFGALCFHGLPKLMVYGIDVHGFCSGHMSVRRPVLSIPSSGTRVDGGKGRSRKLESHNYQSRRWYLRASPGAEVLPDTTVTKELEKTLKLLPKKGTSIPFIEHEITDPIPAKCGAMSFQGSRVAPVTDGPSVSASSVEDKASMVWMTAPLALITAFSAPPFLIGTVLDMVLLNKVLAELLTVAASEVVFYVGLWVFLKATDRVQRPFLQFSVKRWSLITGLRGYLQLHYAALGLKVMMPLMMVLSAQRWAGMPAVVALAPFVIGCIAEICFEMAAQHLRFSSWPLVHIIFEVYRMWQVCRGGVFMERVILGVKQMEPLGARSPMVVMRDGSMFGIIVTLKVVFVVSLLSHLSFLLRLFPSRPVSQRY